MSLCVAIANSFFLGFPSCLVLIPSLSRAFMDHLGDFDWIATCLMFEGPCKLYVSPLAHPIWYRFEPNLLEY